MSFGKKVIKYRWFVLGLLFLVINSCAVWRYTKDAAEDSGISVSLAAGNDGLVSGYDSLSWKFSSAMVADDKVGTWITGTGPLVIEPAVAGRFSWVESDMLVFQPAAKWRDCSEYLVRFDEKLTGVNGEKISGGSGMFHAAPLNLNSVTQMNFDSSRRCTLKLSFNSIPVRPALKDYLSIKNGLGKDVNWEFVGQLSSKDVLVKTEKIATDKFEVILNKGLPAKDGSLSVKDDSIWTVKNVSALVLGSVVPVSKGFEDGYINISFNAPPDMSKIADYMDVTPPVKIVASKVSAYWRSGCKLSGKFEPGKQYTVTLKRGLPALNGAILKKDIQRQVYFPDRPSVITFRKNGQYLSTKGSMLVPINSVNISKVTVNVERIYPNNLVQFAMRESHRYSGYYSWGSRGSSDKLSHTVAEKKYSIAAKPNKVAETMLDMKDLMGEYSSGAFLLTLKSDKGPIKQQLVIVTDIGIAIKQSSTDLLVWANGINSLEPVTGGLIKVYSEQNQEIFNGQTDENGIAHITGDMSAEEKEPFLITIEDGNDISYLKLDGTKIVPDKNIGGAAYLSSDYDAYLFSDRGIYRPGETVHFKAVMRGRDLDAIDQTFPVSLKIIRPDGREYRTVTGNLNEWGTIAYDIELPKYVMTGKYRLELHIPSSKKILGKSQIAVEDFVPPQIRVKADSKQQRITTNFLYTVHANHLFGSPASGLAVSSRIHLQSSLFMPDGWDGYQFSNPENKLKNVNKKVGAKKLDNNGNSSFTYKIPKQLKPSSAIKAIASVTVTEMSGRAVSTYLSRIVDIYSHYVGIKRLHCGDIVKVGEEQLVALAAVTPDGLAADEVSSLQIDISRIEWSSVLKKNNDKTYSYQSERRLIPVSKDEVTLDQGMASYSFTPSVAGQYLLTVTSAAANGGSASIEFYAGSPDDEWQSWSLDKPGHVELVCDKDSYEVGEEADLLIKSPFAGKALITIESDHVIAKRVIDMDGNTAKISIPISNEMLPNVYCTINVIRQAKPEKIWRAHRAVGAIPLAVKVPEKSLNVKINVPAEIRPETSLTATVQITDIDGKGVPAELTIAAVDEGICMLTAFKTPDPLEYFLRKRRLGVEQYDLYNLLMPEISESLRGVASSTGGDAAVALRGRLNPIDAKRFKPVALWRKSVITDADGKAEFKLDVPEFSGELRLMVVAVSKTALGSDDMPVKVKRDVVVLSSLPRFMAPDDKAIMPVNVFNGTDKEQNVIITVNCEGPLTSENNSREIRVKKGGNQMLEFTLSAMKRVGKGIVKISVDAGEEKYDEEFEIAVRPASARVIKSDIGLVKSGETITVQLPDNLLPSTVVSDFICSAQVSVQLNEALDYLLRYPYGCLEQTVSGSFPLLYLVDLIEVIKPGSMTRDDAAQFVQAGIYRVLSMQISNGSFGYWPSYRTTYSWGTVYAVNFLLEAKKAGFTVPEEQLQAAIAYLAKELSKPVRVSSSSSDSSRHNEMRRRSYICYVLALGGKQEHGWIARLQEQKIADTATQLNLAATLAITGKRRVAADILWELGVAKVADTERETYGSLNSGIRNSAMMLQVWLNIDPTSPMVPKLINQLNKMKVNGGWFTTQDNAMALLALGKYSNLMSRQCKPFKAEISWKQNGKKLSREFTDKDKLHLTAKDIPGGTKVTIKNSGPGILYYSWRSSGVPVDGVSVAEDRQMSIRRELLDINGNTIKTNNLPQGSLVVVKISVDTHGKRLRNLAIEDLLPAGLEVENAALKTSQLVPWIKKKKPFVPQHIDIRDDRVVLFIDRIYGKKSYYYVARAVTKGSFVYPAISGECMYDPDVRSTGGAIENGKLKIESE